MDTSQTVRPLLAGAIVRPAHESAQASDLALIGFVALAAAAGRIGLWKPFFGFDAFFLSGATVGSYPIC